MHQNPFSFIHGLLWHICNNNRMMTNTITWHIKYVIGLEMCASAWNLWVSSYTGVQLLHKNFHSNLVLQYLCVHFFQKGMECMKWRAEALVRVFWVWPCCGKVGSVRRVTLMGNEKWFVWLVYSTNTSEPYHIPALWKAPRTSVPLSLIKKIIQTSMCLSPFIFTKLFQ